MCRETVIGHAYRTAFVLAAFFGLFVIAFLFAYDAQDDGTRMHGIIIETDFMWLTIWGMKLLSLATFACVCLGRGLRAKSQIDDENTIEAVQGWRDESRSFAVGLDIALFACIIVSCFFVTAFFLWLGTAVCIPTAMFTSGWAYASKKWNRMCVAGKEKTRIV